jgi:hypothetical protein
LPTDESPSFVPAGRASRRAKQLRNRLVLTAGTLSGNGWKRKGIHWRTLELQQAGYGFHVNAAMAALAAVAARQGLLSEQLWAIAAGIGHRSLGRF